MNNDADFWDIFLAFLGPLLMVVAAVLFGLAMYHYGYDNGFGHGWCGANDTVYVGDGNCADPEMVVPLEREE